MQAKGFLACHHGVTVDAAFHRLRCHARSRNLAVRDVARSILARETIL